jgi:hypothetical protein
MNFEEMNKQEKIDFLNSEIENIFLPYLGYPNSKDLRTSIVCDMTRMVARLIPSAEDHKMILFIANEDMTISPGNLYTALLCAGKLVSYSETVDNIYTDETGTYSYEEKGTLNFIPLVPVERVYMNFTLPEND